MSVKSRTRERRSHRTHRRLVWLGMGAATTLGELRAAGYPDRSVKDEMRANLMAHLARRAPVWPSIVGYGDTVIPALERAILAGHDIIMLGERGQAKSRLIRH